MLLLNIGQHPNYFEHPLLIGLFVLIVLILLVLDLGVFNKNPHIVSNKEAIIWSITWIGLAMLFSLVIWKIFGFNEFVDFQSAYWIEKALSVDNLFVFILVFEAFKVPKVYHHKVLFWGIIGAIILRAIFIFAGVQLLHMTYLPETTFNGLFDNPVRINLLMTVFGIILIIAGWKSGTEKEDVMDKNSIQNSIGARFMRKYFKIIPEYDNDKFFTVKNGIKYGTQLLLVVGIIEFTDLIFAVDSIPAIFAITDSPFILYSSNIFAILGLRSLYFILANFIHLFRFLKYGLSIILIFIGFKMLIAPWYPIPSLVSLIILAVVLLSSVVLSLLIPEKEKANE
ncbi:MAG TPA: hypothetical protein VK027_04295 [Chitinophagaceae bacterium]|nr:hypothetical protein [Chitinophagaceae bacterium]